MPTETQRERRTTAAALPSVPRKTRNAKNSTARLGGSPMVVRFALSVRAREKPSTWDGKVCLGDNVRVERWVFWGSEKDCSSGPAATGMQRISSLRPTLPVATAGRRVGTAKPSSLHRSDPNTPVEASPLDSGLSTMRWSPDPGTSTARHRPGLVLVALALLIVAAVAHAAEVVCLVCQILVGGVRECFKL